MAEKTPTPKHIKHPESRSVLESRWFIRVEYTPHAGPAAAIGDTGEVTDVRLSATTKGIFAISAVAVGGVTGASMQTAGASFNLSLTAVSTLIVLAFAVLIASQFARTVVVEPSQSAQDRLGLLEHAILRWALLLLTLAETLRATVQYVWQIFKP